MTLFPEMFPPILGTSILGRASQLIPDPAAPDDAQRVRLPVVAYHVHDIRAHSTDRHSKVDQSPYGGGPGMVMQCQPVWDAVVAAEAADPRPPLRILTSPRGVPLTQPLVEWLAKRERLLIIAGHYEGLDERVIERLREESPDCSSTKRRDLSRSPPDDHEERDESRRFVGADGGGSDEPHLLEISLGDYVLSGGELAAMVLIDAVVRLLPGALGHAESAGGDSFSPGLAGGDARLLEGPHYTRPREWAGRAVPEILLGGNHAAIEAWRREQAVAVTRERRPELLAALDETPTDIRLLILDVDGVLTDGSIIYDEAGNQIKRFHVHDGMGIRIALEAGVRVAALSSRDSPAVRRRLEELRVDPIVQGSGDKGRDVQRVAELASVDLDEAAYVGDDLLDLPAMRRVAWPVAVADAAGEVRAAARLVTQQPGGRGAVREAIERLLGPKRWEAASRRVLSQIAAGAAH